VTRASLARTLVLRVLARLRSGRLELTDTDGEVHRFGPGGEGPSAAVTIRDPRAWAALLHGSRGLAESYVDGWWESDDLVALIRVAARNAGALDRARETFRGVRVPYQWLRGQRRRNTAVRARSDIRAHYDLGNDLFEVMLDETMMYSAGVFLEPRATLYDASIAKLELVCEKLALGPEHHVVEIGTGWGGFAVHAATTRGCRVTTTTISAEQHAFAQRRAEEAGVADLVTVLRDDYRDLRGRYDALVSLEMIEAVGWRDLPVFFSVCDRLLEPHGAMLLQAILHPHRVFRVEKAAKGLIRELVFPGGTLPSMYAIERSLARRTDLRAVALDDITPHYARTLAFWRERFHAAWPELRTLGYDARFRRLWDLYLAYCEAGFHERRISDVQLLLAKPGWRGEAVAPLAPAASPVPSVREDLAPEPVGLALGD
jgi:cyclopropane-fatty-acyl-phospholipid synthase